MTISSNPQKLAPPDNEPPDLTKAPGYRVRWLYENARPLRPLLDHLGLHELAQDRGADWIECNCLATRVEIAEKYRRELTAAFSWGLCSLALETAIHTGIAKITLVVVDATTISVETLARYTWQSAVALGVVVTLLHRRRRK